MIEIQKSLKASLLLAGKQSFKETNFLLTFDDVFE